MTACSMSSKTNVFAEFVFVCIGSSQMDDQIIRAVELSKQFVEASFADPALSSRILKHMAYLFGAWQR